MVTVPMEVGIYVEQWLCPNVQNHGTLVPCMNTCGDDVPNPYFHYHSVDDLIGSGKWMCIRTAFFDQLYTND